MTTWSSFISPEEVADTVSYYNEKVGESRQLPASTAVSLVEQAFSYYNYLESEERSDAIRYDLQSFCEYATTGFNVEDQLSFSDRYSTLLSSGHPYSPAQNKSLVADWISGAPELSAKSRAAIVASLSPEADLDVVKHANVRLALMAQQGELSTSTMYLLERALTLN